MCIHASYSQMALEPGVYTMTSTARQSCHHHQQQTAVEAEVLVQHPTHLQTCSRNQTCFEKRLVKLTQQRANMIHGTLTPGTL